MAIEIVSFPINSMVIFHTYVSLPEGWDCSSPKTQKKHGETAMEHMVFLLLYVFLLLCVFH